MNRILSWKIDSCTYAYIFPINNSYISNRIPEDSLLWDKIITTISNEWKEKDYWDNFEKMQTEVKSKCNVFIPKNDKYWDFPDDNTNLPVNIVLLAGKDGEGYANGSNGTGSGEGSEVYDKFVDAINKELDKAKKDIEEQNKRVEEFVEQKVGETIAEAKNTIAETKKELTETRAELEDKLDSAADALEKAAALFDMGEGGITGEKIQEALSSVNEYGEWITANSGTVNDFKTDYDAAKRIMGGIGSAEDALAGLFSQIGTTINDMDKTVGNVESWMVASAATIGDIATWYDVNASAVTEASSIINASAGTITDAINFISGDGLTTKVTSIMDGRNAVIKDEIMTETSAAVTNVRNILNGLSGVVETSVTRLNGIDGELTNMGRRMDAAEGTMETYMTVSDSAMTLANDLRDTWSVESGKLSTVANLTAETDGEGNIIYYVSAVTGDEIIVSKTPDGEWVDAYGTTYADERVYVHWSQAIGSYIQQQASSITMSVMNSSGLTAAIKLAIERGESGEEKESVIKLISEKLVITGDMIAQAISANTANIGGIHMGKGQIWSEASNDDGTPKFKLNGVDGKIIANDGFFKGEIEADSGYFIGAITANSLTLGNDATEIINGMIDDKLPDGKFVELDNWVSGITDGKTTKVKISTNGLLQAQNAIISGSVYTTNGYFEGEIVATKGSVGGINISESSISQKDNKFSLNSDGSGQLASSSITWDSSGNLTVDGSIFNPVYTTSDSSHLNRTVFVDATSLGAGFGLNAGSYKSSNVNSTNKIKRVGTITLINNGTSPAFFNLSNTLEVGCVTANRHIVSSQMKPYNRFILLPGITVVFDVFDKYDGSKRILRSSTPLGWFWYNGTIIPCSYNNALYKDLSEFKLKEEALGTKTSMATYESANILTIPSGVVEYMSIQLDGAPNFISKNYNDYVVFSFYKDGGFMEAAPKASDIKNEKYLTPVAAAGTDFKSGGDFRVCSRGSIDVTPATQSLIVKLYDKNSMIGYANIRLFKYVEQ